MTKITIELSKKEMDAIEDAFFTKLTDQEWFKIRMTLLDIWEKLCGET